MLCQVCRQRNANVHQTFIASGHSERRDLCEVCAGRKTEAEWERERADEKKRREAEAIQRQERLRQMAGLIDQKIFTPRRTEIGSRQIRAHGIAMDSATGLALLGINSPLPEVDPLAVLFGAVEAGKTHVLSQVEDCAVHIFLWEEDPVRRLKNIFHPFPDAGAQLDFENGFLLVERERTLFADSKRSVAFCNLAARQFHSGDASKPGRFQFRPKVLAELFGSALAQNRRWQL